MSYRLARSLLFRLDPERAHEATLKSLRLLDAAGLASLAGTHVPEHRVQVMGLDFPNPVGLAAGMDKNGECLHGLAAMGFGYLEIGTVTPRPQEGNPAPRMFRLPEHQAVINRLGFNNRGVDHLVQQVRASRYQGILGINIGKNRDTPNERAVEDYLHCLREVHGLASYVTVNISSPNTQGLRELQHDDALNSLLKAVLEERDALSRASGRMVPIAVKVAPDLADAQIDALARCFNELGPEAVIATNTTIDRPGVESHPLAAESGGLSGAPLLPAANRVLKALRDQLDPSISLIGVGGITDQASAASKFEAGASLVQIYTGLIYHGAALIRDAVHGARQACD